MMSLRLNYYSIMQKVVRLFLHLAFSSAYFNKPRNLVVQFCAVFAITKTDNCWAAGIALFENLHIFRNSSQLRAFLVSYYVRPHNVV